MNQPPIYGIYVPNKSKKSINNLFSSSDPDPILTDSDMAFIQHANSFRGYYYTDDLEHHSFTREELFKMNNPTSLEIPVLITETPIIIPYEFTERDRAIEYGFVDLIFDKNPRKIGRLIRQHKQYFLQNISRRIRRQDHIPHPDLTANYPKPSLPAKQ